MTVEEAKIKWCPMLNDGCNAYLCMAWRWCDPNTKNEGYCGFGGKEGAE